ncbi:MAG: HAMP domain-containing histidine kinase [Anaerolineales bacterium]|nr:MAG: HAMP domain-containing histidine kinase [Anaerolineales bacterium]
MFRSLQSRLFLTYLLVTVLVLTVIGLLLIYFLLQAPNPIGQQIEYRRLDFWISQFSSREARGLLALPPNRLPEVMERVDQMVKARTLLVGADGEVLGDSRPEEEPLSLDILTKVAASKTDTRGLFRYTPVDRWLYVSSPLGDQRWMILIAPQPTLRALGLLGNELLRTLLVAGSVALLFSIILAWLIAHWVTAPLRRMVGASKAVAAGKYDQQLPLTGPEEVQSLAAAFNEMVRRVQTSRQAQRDFVANVSHELKTPLTSIQGFAQAILDGTAQKPEDQQHAARVIYDESNRLRRLVEDLLDLARIDTGQVAFERHPVDLGALLRSVVERLSVRAEEVGVRIESRLPDFPPIVGDGDRLAQVFTNLIDNAVKHSSEGGVVNLMGERDGGWISIHFDDAGPGIPPEELSRIFERFYQLDKARPGGRGRGVGLGLAISREIVQAHGGRLVAQSAVGRGSRFTVQLPIIRPDDSTLVRSHS